MAEASSHRIRRRWPRWLAVAALVLVVVVLAFAYWLLGTSAGLSQAVQWLTRWGGDAVQVSGASGRIAGPLRIERVRLRTATLHLDAEQIELDWSPSALLRGMAKIESITVEDLVLATAPGDGSPAQAPTEIPLPVAVDVQHLRLGRLALAPFPLEAGAGEPIVAPLLARVSTEGGRIALHVESVQTPWGGGSAELSLARSAPMALAGSAQLSSDAAGPTLSAQLTLGGVLEAIELGAQLEGAGATARVESVLTPFAELPARALSIDAKDIDPSRWRAGWPKARLSLQADLAAEDARLVGPVKMVNAEPGRLDQAGLPVRTLALRLGATPAALTVEDLVLALAGGGQISGSAAWAAQAPARARLALGEVNLQALDARLPASALGGTVTVDADAQTQRVDAQLADAGLEAHLQARQADGQVNIEQLRIVQGTAEASATGTLALDGPMPFEMHLESRGIDPSAFWAEAPVGRISGTVAASGEAAVPRLSARYTLANSRLAGQPLSGEGQLAWEDERLAQVDAHLALGDNRLEASGAWGRIEDQLDWRLSAPQLDQFGLALAGSAELNGRLSGGREAPSGRIAGSASALSLPGEVRIRSVRLSARLDEGLDGRIQAAVEAGDVRIGTGTTVDTVALALNGTRGAHVAEVSAQMGADAARLALRGALDDTPGWRGQLTELNTSGRLVLALEAPIDVAVAADEARIGAGRLTAGRRGEIVLEPTRWSPGRLSSAGRFSGLSVGLQAASDGPARARRGDLVLGGEWDLAFGAQAKGTVHLFRESGDLILVGDTVVRFGLSRFDLLATVEDQRLAASVDAAGSALGTLTGSATARLVRRDGLWKVDQSAPLLGSADLDIPSIAWIGTLASPVVRTDGHLKAAFSLSGTPAKPVGTGQITGQDLLMEIVTEGLRLSGGTLDARFDAEQLEVRTLRFGSESQARPRDSRVPYAELTRTPGTLSASGTIQLADGEGGLDIEADRLPLFQRPDRWLAISGKGRMDTRWEAPRIEASMRADGGYLEFARPPAPSLSGDVTIVGDEVPAAGSERQLKVRLGIDLGDQLYLSALGLDTRLAGQLTLVANSGEPLRATGSLNTVGGTYEGYGQKLAIERGVVNFQGPLDNPGLNVVALRKGLEVEAGVSISGTVRRPVVSLVSSPDVPDAEKLSWMVLGRSLEDGGGSDLGLLLPAAQALFGGPGGGISSQLAMGLGVDELSIGQGDLNSVGRSQASSVVGGGYSSRDATVSGQVLSVGKRLSADTTLSFEQSLSGVEHVVKLTHQLSRRLAVIGRAGTDNAVDLQWSLSFR